MMTYMILTDDTRRVIYRLRIRLASEHPNLRLDLPIATADPIDNANQNTQLDTADPIDNTNQNTHLDINNDQLRRQSLC